MSAKNWQYVGVLFLTRKRLLSAKANSYISPKIEAYLERIYSNWKAQSEKLANDHAAISSAEAAKIARLIGEQEELATLYKRLIEARSSLSQLRTLMQQDQEDLEMKNLVESELRREQEAYVDIEKDIKDILVRPGAEDLGNAILEVRTGTGGTEASLFAGEILRMYQKYALLRGWQFRIVRLIDESGTVHELSAAESSLVNFAGVRDARVHVHGRSAFGRLRHECGIHRVQRVPLTEAQGRVHTSTVTVAVLPELEEIVIDIPERDLRVDSFKSSGPGGQHVNKTNSAIRIVHLPTGLSVAVQEERCAQQNRIRAMAILRERLYQLRHNEQMEARRAVRHSQIGNAGRSDKIRTYNFTQARITDHRLGMSIYDLDGFFAGRLLDDFIEQLHLVEESNKLASIG